MLIGVTGQCIDSLGYKRIAGAGKDVVAKRLVDNHNFISLAWADPLKRFCKEVYEFPDEALWGESDARVLPDKRYPRPEGGFLTPRFALQSLGTDWGRNCYLNTWVDYGIRTAKRILGGQYYTPKNGLSIFEPGGRKKPKGVVFSDVRFMNELSAIKEAGGKVVRIKRQIGTPYDAEAMNLLHDSETELPNTPDELFDYIIDNSGTLDDLMIKIDNMVEELRYVSNSATIIQAKD
jgi:hypothetical protein